jgi:ATP adenylyltransferase
MTHLKIIVVVLVSLLFIVMAVQNDAAMSQKIQLKLDLFVFDEISTGEVSVYQVAIVAFLLGLVAAGFYAIVEHFRLKKQIKLLSAELQDKDQELNSLRNLPITSEDVHSGQTEGV